VKWLHLTNVRLLKPELKFIPLDSLSFYQKLDKIPFLKTLALKVAFVAFVGIHLPLILSIVVLVVFKVEASPAAVILYLFIFTLIASAITLYYLNKVVEPIRLLNEKLQVYTAGEKWKITPANWRDETGELGRNLDTCIHNLEHTLKDKNELYRLLSHDLKGMLATLQAGLMMLQMDFNESDKDASLLKDKIELVERQILSVNSLLYYYRDPVTMNILHEVSSIQLRSITSEVVSLYSSALRMDNKEIKILISDDVSIYSGKFLIRHLIFNLVDNAVKYSEKGSTVFISFENGKFQVSNEKNKQMAFGTNDWQRSTGLGHKIISKTAEDLGLPLMMDYCEEKYSVTLELLSVLKKAS
jgi:signal transduction histidine kinase